MNDVVARIAQRSVAKRESGYADEVRRLLDAALQVIGERGTTSRPRVADIVRASGLSNDAFYRHFASKDTLVAAILEDGTHRLTAYVAHQMSKESTPEAQVCSWVSGVLSQASEDSAATTRAVLWNAGALTSDTLDGPPSASGPLAALLREPFTELGSPEPDVDASLAAHAIVGALSDHLWKGTVPGDVDVERIAAFCLRTASRPGACPSE
ncbi:TetR/AcrR family transcriptional regulator [Rhodococcus triatomae]|nr:TetR family transcriptional regulator [Rhodococcus triatomae BKS 15-14]